MTPETGEPDMCLMELESYFSSSQPTVMSAEEPRALSVRTAHVPSSWTRVSGSLRGVHRRQNLR